MTGAAGEADGPLGTVMWPSNEAPPQDTLRSRALAAIKTVQWVPAAGENRITGMIENRPDWVVSRQRAWGVPIAVFVKQGTNEILKDERVNAAIAAAFEREGADAWFEPDAAARFLGAAGLDAADYEKVDDILDVWFDSGSTHAFTLEVRDDLKARRRIDGGPDTVMYLEGSDQHRGWFHSSLLESCGTRGRAPFDVVLTHGFVLDERGEKMSKSKGNVTAPQDVIKDSGADILRLWVAASDYSDDLRIGPEILKTFVETYRKLRNTIRWMLGSLHHFRDEDRVAPERHAGAGALHPAPPRRARRRHPRGLRGLRLQAGRGASQRLHDERPLGLLLRHPQGRALLRSDLEPAPQERADGHRPDLPLRRRLDRADPRLHGRGGVAVALPRRGRLGPPRDLSRGAAGLAGRGFRRALGEGAPGAPRRHRRARDRARAEAHRLEPRGGADGLHRRRRARRRPRRGRLRRDLHHFEHRRPARRGPGGRLPARRGEGRRRRAGARRGPQMRPLVEDLAPRRQRSRLSGRDAARRRGAARMGRGAGGDESPPASAPSSRSPRSPSTRPRSCISCSATTCRCASPWSSRPSSS